MAEYVSLNLDNHDDDHDDKATENHDHQQALRDMQDMMESFTKELHQMTMTSPLSQHQPPPANTPVRHSAPSYLPPRSPQPPYSQPLHEKSPNGTLAGSTLPRPGFSPKMTTPPPSSPFSHQQPRPRMPARTDHGDEELHQDSAPPSPVRTPALNLLSTPVTSTTRPFHRVRPPTASVASSSPRPSGTGNVSPRPPPPPPSSSSSSQQHPNHPHDHMNADWRHILENIQRTLDSHELRIHQLEHENDQLRAALAKLRDQPQQPCDPIHPESRREDPRARRDPYRSPPPAAHREPPSSSRHFSPGTQVVAELSTWMELQDGYHAPLSLLVDKYWDHLSHIRRQHGFD